MALVDPSIAMSFRGLQLPPPTNVLAQYAQLAQLQGAQQQQQMGAIQMEEAQRRLERLRQDDAAVERIRQAAMQHGGPSDPIAIEDAMIGSGNPDYMKQGLAMRQHRQAKSEFQQIYGRMFPGMFPETPAAAAPAPTPEPSGAVVGGPVAPPSARVTPTPLGPPGGPAPVNALAPTGTIEGMPLNQLRATQIALGSSTDPRAKTLSTIIEKEIESRKQPDIVRSYEYAKTAAGGGFTGSLADWKKLSAAQQSVVMKQEGAFETGLGKGQAEKVFASQTAAEDAAQILTSNADARALLDQGMITGAGAEFLVSLNQGLKQIGVDLGYADAAANAQAYAAVLGNNVGKLIKQFGAGTGLSDADREFAKQIAGGRISLDEKALRRILDINDRAARKAIEIHNKKYGGIKTNIPLTVEMPAAPAPAAAAPITNIPQAAIDRLLSGAGTNEQFDAIFGPGAAQRVRGGR